MPLHCTGEPPLWMDEMVAGRLYTGPCFLKYNATLRGFPAWVLELCAGNQ